MTEDVMNRIRRIHSSLKYVLFIIVVGCSNLSSNDFQKKSTLLQMDCYKSLIKQITQDSQKINEIKGIRNSKKKGRYDPITVKQTYRLIGIPELEEVLDTSWQNYCGSQLAKTNDLKGIRFIDEALIIIEIDEFNRHTLTEKYSREKTKEFHRLIISSKRVENENFYFGEEYLLQRDTLENNWIYEVTQMKMIH